jgi:hypothetical protein
MCGAAAVQSVEIFRLVIFVSLPPTGYFVRKKLYQRVTRRHIVIGQMTFSEMSRAYV